MPKVGVYIPRERMPDIEKWRDKINFSQLFMKAFDEKLNEPSPNKMSYSTTLSDPDKGITFHVTATAKTEIDGAGRTLIEVTVDSVDEASIELNKWDYPIQVSLESEPSLRRWVERHFEQELAEQAREHLRSLMEGDICLRD